MGKVVDGEMILIDARKMVEKIWYKRPKLRPHIGLDEFVIMPNHIYRIYISWEKALLTLRRAVTLQALQKNSMANRSKGSISTIIRFCKYAVTKSVNELFDTR